MAFDIVSISLFALILDLSYIPAIVHSTYKDDSVDTLLTSDSADQSHHKRTGGSLIEDFAYTATTDESKLKLAILFDEKIDTNKDGSVQLDELVSWLRECQDRYSREDVNRHWTAYGKPLDDVSSIEWKRYAEREYDHLLALMKQSGDPEQVDRIKKSHEYHLQRDLRRWKTADLDQSGRLTRNEFKLFLYPENYELMHDVVVEEKFELIDKNKDGKISSHEYLSDQPPGEAHYNKKQHEDWLEEGRSKFVTQLDLNHDNYLDKSELATWISKSEQHDHSISEAQHLMQSADSSRDHRLSKEEVLAAYHEFVNSHATDFGEALRGTKQSSHDEL